MILVVRLKHVIRVTLLSHRVLYNLVRSPFGHSMRSACPIQLLHRVAAAAGWTGIVPSGSLFVVNYPPT